VALHGVTKRFPGVIANDGIDFEAAEGEVHALLGENGAGKTTLAHILTGLYTPDEGAIELYGRRVDFSSPRDAIEAGVCMVHQHFRLVSPFTVAENIILGDTKGAGRRFRINPGSVERQVRELGERYGLPVDPRARIWQLSVGEQQRVEILKALYQEARILILDEPTAVLTPQEAETLFATLRQMAAEGRTVIFISHKLQEVKAVSDRVTILRAGRAITTASTADATPRSLAAMMVGREVRAVHRPRQEQPDGPAVLEIHGLSARGDRGPPAVRDVSFAVRAGEIVAIAGVAGNGQRELAETITGLRPPTAGSVSVRGRRLHGGAPREAIEAGIAYVPEDRLGTGVAPACSITTNAALKSYRRTSFGPLLRGRLMRRRAEKLIETYDVKASSAEMEAGKLSGGNLQKLVIGREFSSDPQVLVAASPTRGLDVAAIEAVHTYLIEAAARGVAILLISEDLDEILALNDRIVVMYEGRLDEVGREETVEEIGLRMTGGELAVENTRAVS
jgi:simple sugar transport system ATP-binding protein